jgi:hypothetical protein
MSHTGSLHDAHTITCTDHERKAVSKMWVFFLVYSKFLGYPCARRCVNHCALIAKSQSNSVILGELLG